MPANSNKRKCVEYLMENALCRMQEYYATLPVSYDEDNDDVDEIWDDLNEDLLLVLAEGGLPARRAPKVPTTASSADMERLLGVSRAEFKEIYDLICKDPVFSETCDRYSIELQLSIGLYRLRHSGVAASMTVISKLFNIECAEAVTLITKQVFAALLKLLSKYLHWPSEAERLEIISDSFEELPFCIGYIGCSEIKLSQMPSINHNMYASKADGYAIKVQIVCDHRLCIRNVVIGNPGTLREADVLENCEIFRSKKLFFSEKEWIAAGPAYPLTKTIITPYHSSAQEPDNKKIDIFNEEHLRYRLRVENCFRKLKEQFRSLQELAIHIKDKESLTFCNQWVLVCCILHNVLLSKEASGSLSELHAFDGSGEACGDELELTEHANLQAQKKRRTICQLLN